MIAVEAFCTKWEVAMVTPAEGAPPPLALARRQIMKNASIWVVADKREMDVRTDRSDALVEHAHPYIPLAERIIGKFTRVELPSVIKFCKGCFYSGAR